MGRVQQFLRDQEVHRLHLLEGKAPKSLGEKALLPFLWVASVGYKWGVTLRNWGYNRGWMRTLSPPLPLLSVGNVVAGGTGKTPLTILLAQQLSKEMKVAVISRGYRSQRGSSSSPLVVSRGEGPCCAVAECGDEPYLIAKRVPQAIVVVHPHRFSACRVAQQLGAEFLLLDDGFQHRQLMRQWDVVTLNVQDPLSRGAFLPRGFLRDSPRALKRADLIVLMGAEDEASFQKGCEEIAPYVTAPIVGAQLHPSHLEGALEGNVEQIANKKIGAFCAIANPSRFYRSLEKKGGKVVERKSLPDHVPITEQELTEWSQRAEEKGAEILLCTEKDGVKLPPLPLPCSLSWMVCQLKVNRGGSFWEELIQQLVQSKKRLI